MFVLGERASYLWLVNRLVNEVLAWACFLIPNTTQVRLLILLLNKLAFGILLVPENVLVRRNRRCIRCNYRCQVRLGLRAHLVGNLFRTCFAFKLWLNIVLTGARHSLNLSFRVLSSRIHMSNLHVLNFILVLETRLLIRKSCCFLNNLNAEFMHFKWLHLFRNLHFVLHFVEANQWSFIVGRTYTLN